MPGLTFCVHLMPHILNHKVIFGLGFNQGNFIESCS